MGPACFRIEEEGRLGWRVRATEPIQRGARLLAIEGRPTSAPDRYSVQLSADVHLAPAGAAWALANHSCNPNLVIDFDPWELVACRDIAVGEELTWNYLTTEWELHAPFECACDAPSCVRIVRGFRHLTLLERSAIAGLLSPFLRSRLHTDDPASGRAELVLQR